MSISTYTELKTELAAWLHRDDLTSKIPDFIQMGEAALNRRLRTVDMETLSYTALSTSARSIAYPTGFKEMISLWIVDPWQEIVYVDPGVFNESVTSDTATGTPSLFTLNGKILLDVIPSSADQVRMHYLKNYNIASDATNWLLTNHPMAYMSAALTAAQIYIMDDPRLPLMKQVMENEIREINDQEARKRGSSMAYLRVENSLQVLAGENIETGA